MALVQVSGSFIKNRFLNVYLVLCNGSTKYLSLISTSMHVYSCVCVFLTSQCGAYLLALVNILFKSEK